MTAGLAARLRTAWDLASVSALGLNSYLLLYHRTTGDTGLRHVICSGAVFYGVTLLVLLIRYRRRPEGLAAFRTARKVFRLIYTALCLTGIMLDICARTGLENDRGLIAWYGVQFFWAVLWGTSCLWLGRAVRTLRRFAAGPRGGIPAAETHGFDIEEGST